VDTPSHTFVVRVWLEEAAGRTTPAVWRGHVTHVLDEQRRYVQSLGEIQAFIAGYLCEMGVAAGEVAER
jgi:hypothetical protein